MVPVLSWSREFSLFFGWYRYRYWKKLVPEKVLVPVPEKILGTVTAFKSQSRGPRSFLRLMQIDQLIIETVCNLACGVLSVCEQGRGRQCVHLKNTSMNKRTSSTLH